MGQATLIETPVRQATSAAPAKRRDGNVHLVYTGRIEKVKRAVDRANEILKDPEFYGLIRDYRKFGEDLPPDLIAELMESRHHSIRISVDPLMPVDVATTRSASSIKLSYWNFPSELPAGVNTMVHETVKAVSLLHQEHPNTDEHRQTAPWVIGSIAEIMVK